MIHVWFRLLAAIVVGVMLSPTAIVAAENDQPKPPAVVVLELFTSQGCSSCPPADELLAQISKLNDEHKLPVVCLSFHVDYWNSLGWKDPYSKAQFSERQRDYARAFKSRSVYTPQLVVNGQTEFVGSKASAAREAIRKALQEKSRTQIDLEALWDEDKNRVVIEYSIQGADVNDVLNLALVQKQGANEVPRGENAGEALTHVNIVREFKTLAIEENGGRIEMKLPTKLSSKDVRVIAYVQDIKSKQIVGVASSDFSRK